jgi:putative ABC transport system ATP-binding protein
MTRQDVDVQLEGVAKSYGDIVVLAGIDLAIHHGQFVAILGRSGTGKSTLLNLIGGLDDPTRGRVYLLGQALATLSETQRSMLRARSLGFVFQFFNLIPTLTARENVELPLALNGIPKLRARERARALLGELDLAGCADRFPDELSGGEQQRIAIARAVAHEPAIVLADEPTGNLDLDTGRIVLELLNNICRGRGTTLIMATHSDEVVAIADRVLRVGSSGLEERPA